MTTSLQNILSRSFIKTALMPLLVMGLVLVVLYFGVTEYYYQKSTKALLDQTQQTLNERARLEAGIISAQLGSLSNTVGILQNQTQEILEKTQKGQKGAEKIYKYTEQNLLYKAENDGGSFVFYSTLSKNPDQRLAEAVRTEALDPLFRSINNSNPNISATFINTADGMSRIYPYFDIHNFVPFDVDLTSYNFFYKAGPENNKEREIVWTDVYLDPAGQGWLASCIAPIYVEDMFYGVVGVDITVLDLANVLLKQSTPKNTMAMLMNNKGKIMAMPRPTESVLGVEELTDHFYTDIIAPNTFKPETFDFSNNENISIKPDMNTILNKKSGTAEISTLKGDYVLGYAATPNHPWYIFLIQDKGQLLAPTEKHLKEMHRVGFYTIGFMVLFYLAFIAYVLFTSRKISQDIARPVQTLTDESGKLARADAAVEFTPSNIEELDTLQNNFSDMTKELHAVQKRMREQVQKASTKNAVKTEFLGSVSHELRTPLNSIMSTTDLIGGTHLTPDQSEMVVLLKQASKNLKVIINDLLDISRVETGTIKVQDVNVNIGELMLTTAAMHKKKAASRDVELHTQIPTQPLWVMTDAVRLRQIFNNFLSNAEKNTLKGEILFSVEPIIQENESQFFLRFTVSDTGKGFSKTKLKTLREYLQLKDSLVPANTDVVGMGLTLTNALVRALNGGPIKVISEEDSGTIFQFDIAVKSGKAEDKPEELNLDQICKEGLFKEMNILIAEDNKVNQIVLGKTLSRLGVENVQFADDGQQALEMASSEESKFDLIFMDIQMPVMTGTEATEAIRKAGLTLPICAITAHALSYSKEMCLTAGMDDYIVKPFHISDIVDALEKYRPRA
ncbi:MAG: response regulator [Desulfovibrio sp.]